MPRWRGRAGTAPFSLGGKSLRGAVRQDGSRVFVITAVRHDDTLTAALREIGAKTNEIPEFAPLLETGGQVGDGVDRLGLPALPSHPSGHEHPARPGPRHPPPGRLGQHRQQPTRSHPSRNRFRPSRNPMIKPDDQDSPRRPAREGTPPACALPNRSTGNKHYSGMRYVDQGVPTVAEYQALRASVGWGSPSPEECGIALSGTTLSMVARSGDQVVGMVRAVGDTAMYLLIVDVMVHPEHQGSGLGRRMVTALVDEAVRHRTRSVLLVADDGVVPFYETQGFSTDPSRLMRYLPRPM